MTRDIAEAPDAPLAGTPNRAARLARWLGRGGHRHSPLLRLIVIGMIAIAWIALSVWGEVLREDGRSWAALIGDALYRPFTFLSPDGAYADAGSIPPQWAAARFFGGLLPVIGLFWVLRRWLVISLGRIVVRYAASGHVVILSRDGAANALAEASSRAGDCVVLIDASLADDDAGRDLLVEAGVVVMALPPSTGALRRARVTRADQTACWSPCDSQSLEDALILQALPLRPDSEIALRVSSHETGLMLRSMAELMQTDDRRFRPIAPEATLLRQRLGSAELVADAGAASHAAVCVALHGGGPTLPMIGELALRHHWSIHLGPPALVIVVEPGAGESGFERLAETLAGHAGIFEPGMAPSVRHVTWGDLVAAPGVTRHLIDSGGDDATLAHAFALAAAVAQQSGHACRIQPVLRDSRHLGHYLASHSPGFVRPIDLGQRRPLGLLLERPEDEAAARLHQAYQAANGGEPVAAIRWRALPETLIHANRAAADHIAIKRWDADRARAAGMDEAAMLQALAATEHRRWCTERLLDGWLPGPRDNARRLHDKLVPWDALSAADQKKDVDQVLLALAQPWDRRS